MLRYETLSLFSDNDLIMFEKPLSQLFNSQVIRQKINLAQHATIWEKFSFVTIFLLNRLNFAKGKHTIFCYYINRFIYFQYHQAGIKP